MADWLPPNFYHNTLKLVAEGCTSARDHAYYQVENTPLGYLVDRISDFLTNNASLIFWGGAAFFAATSPTFFFAGAGAGMLVGLAIPYDPAAIQNIDFTALKQVIKTIILIVSFCLNPQASYFVSGCTPGFHTVRVLNGYYFELDLRGTKALMYELDTLCYELSRWIPFLDFRFHSRLCEAKANRDTVMALKA